MQKVTAASKKQWVNWLETYDKNRLFDSLIQSIQGAKSTCVHCGENIYCDIVEGGGVPDWGTRLNSGGLDYGCFDSPDTNDDGTGGHEPERD